MKITKQISPTEYVIEIDPEEINQRKSNTHMVIAHDYIQFMGTTPIFTKPPLMIKTERGGGINYISVSCDLQIPIRPFVFGLLPWIVKHEYCQEEHAGKYNNYPHNTTFFDENGRKMIALCEKGFDPHIMPYEVYERLTNKN